MSENPIPNGNPMDPERPQCTARSKQSGERCRAAPVAGSSVCRMHGAGGGRPIVHGRYSKVLRKLRRAYEAGLADDGLLDLRETCALLDALVQRLIARAEEGDVPAWRERLLAAFERAREPAQAALARGDVPAFEAALREVRAILEAGATEAERAEFIAQHVERLARVIERVWAVKLAQGNAVNRRDLVAILAKFIDLVCAETSPEAAQRVARRLQVEIMRPHGLGEASKN